MTPSIVYAMADVFVHLNDYSKSLLAPQRPSQQHVVIPHGDYSYYQRLPQSWSAAEEALGSSQDKLILVFGAEYASEWSRAPDADSDIRRKLREGASRFRAVLPMK